MTWSYSITSGADGGMLFPAKFGMGVRIPFLSRILPGSGNPHRGELQRSVWPFTSSGVCLVSSRPAAEGLVLHLREAAGERTELKVDVNKQGWHLEEVDALGKRLQGGPVLQFAPFEAKFVRIWHRS